MDGFKFLVTNEQERVIRGWFKTHKHPFWKKDRHLTYVFDTNSGIGNSVSGVCSCGKSIDVTDYKRW